MFNNLNQERSGASSHPLKEVGFRAVNLVTLRKELRERLGAKPGDKIIVRAVDNGLLFTAANNRANLEETRARLAVLNKAHDNGIRLSLEEIKAGIEDAYAESGASGLR
ncbi:MAG: AbrB/MazE/SpoVT family DNA-binding domain-containing protein [Actinomycetaceae bacterium]|nr:AbrB/MazE/SpoVT family DNA-binding domain-containing protein [Actinomycetaceae bacterium]